MKRRASFVSNSSSSSFLVLSSGRDDFRAYDDKWRFDIFINDYNRADKSSAESVILSFLQRLVERQFWKIEYNAERIAMSLNNRDCLDCQGMEHVIDRCDRLGVPKPGGFLKKILDARRNLEDYADSIRKENPSWNSPEIKELWRKADEECSRLLEDPLLQEYSRMLAERFPQSCELEYEDHTEPGDSMEHSFMPSLASDAQKDGASFAVFRISNH